MHTEVGRRCWALFGQPGEQPIVSALSALLLLWRQLSVCWLFGLDCWLLFGEKLFIKITSNDGMAAEIKRETAKKRVRETISFQQVGPD